MPGTSGTEGGRSGGPGPPDPLWPFGVADRPARPGVAPLALAHPPDVGDRRAGPCPREPDPRTGDFPTGRPRFLVPGDRRGDGRRGLGRDPDFDRRPPGTVALTLSRVEPSCVD